MRILGIDPGTRVCGYGIIDMEGSRLSAVGYGVVRGREPDMPGRLKAIYEGLVEVIGRFDPKVAAVEETFYGVNPRTAIKMGEGRGVVLLAAACCGLEVFEYSPATVKRAVVGSGRADKSQVQQMVRHILGLAEVPEPDDAADALAIAICHCHRIRSPDFK